MCSNVNNLLVVVNLTGVVADTFGSVRALYDRHKDAGILASLFGLAKERLCLPWLD